MTPLEREAQKEAQKRAETVAGLHALADALAADEELPLPTSFYAPGCMPFSVIEDGQVRTLSTPERFRLLRAAAERHGAEVIETLEERRVDLRFGPVEYKLFVRKDTRPFPAPSRIVPASEDAALIGGGR